MWISFLLLGSLMCTRYTSLAVLCIELQAACSSTIFTYLPWSTVDFVNECQCQMWISIIQLSKFYERLKAHDLDYQGIRHIILVKLTGVPVPREEVLGSSPTESSDFFKVCVCKKYYPSSPPALEKSINYVQENVKNCTLISHFASASGGCSQPPYRYVAHGPHSPFSRPFSSDPF